MASDPFIVSDTDLNWTNEHLNVKRKLKARWRVENEALATIPDLCRTAALRIQSLVQQALLLGVQVRACGSRWSFSDIPVVANGWMIETDRLNAQGWLAKTQLDPAYSGTVEELWMAQCGASIAEINKAIETPQRGRALRTSGASNGQTIGGMIGTGVHGSAINVGGIESQVAGLQLITAKRILWLEHPNAPVVTAAYAAKLGAMLVRDADMFAAALVGLGAVGVVGAVLLRTTGRYGLKSSLVHIPYDQIRPAMMSLNFAGAPLPAPGGTPYFFQAIMDPGSMATAYCNIRYKTGYPAGDTPVYKLKDGHQPGTDLPGLIGKIIDIAPDLRGVIVRALIASELKPFDDPVIRTPGQTYTYTQARRHVASSSFAVPVAQVPNALELMRQAFAEKNSAPVVFTCRYTQKSPGLLSFTRYDPTCVIDIDGVDSPESQRLIARVPTLFDQAGMPYTQHWGKLNHLTKARVRRGYGGDVDRWNAARKLILPDPAERAIFSSPFIDAVGLNA